MKKVLLLAMLSMALFVSSTAMAQNLKVSGTVTTSEDGLPVIGATVMVEGTTTAVSTDLNGKYQITVPSSSSKTLVASFFGMTPQQKPVTRNGEVLDFILHIDAQAIEGVIVTGYGSARKIGTVVGSIEQVSSKDLENRPSSNVMDALQGKVAGLQIFTSSGEPGAVQSIKLHGNGSLGSNFGNSDTSPLYILDGMPVSQNTIQAMNINDFESVSVLKDASATSIYGSRAANGVIVYTTKRGSRGAATITASAYYGISNPASTKTVDNMMSTLDLWDLWTDLGDLEADTRDYYVSQGFDKNNTNWYEYFNKQNVPVYNVDLSISGGSEKVNYYISGNLYNQEGTSPGSYYTKANFRTNVNADLKPWLKMGANVQLMYSDSRSNPYQGDLYSIGGLAYTLNPMYSPYYEEDGVQKEYWDEVIPGIGSYNPNYLLDMMKDVYKDYITSSSAYITIEPIDNLIITSRGGLEFTYRDRNYLRSPDYAGTPGNGYAIRSASKYLTTTITNTIEYSFDIDENNSMTALVGQEGVAYSYDTFSASSSGISDSRLTELENGTQSTYAVSSGSSAYTFLSYFGRLDYSYKDMLYFDASVRNDQSSRFTPDNRAATFWAVGGMWNIKNTFLKENDVISDLRFKVSYGTQGNASIGNYAWQGVYGPSSQQYASSPAWAVGQPFNSQLTWENQSKLTLAVNLSLWNKLDVNVEYYIRDTKDMILGVPYPSTSGIEELTKNVGKLRNSGIDIAIDYDILRERDYSLSVGATFNYNAQKIMELFDGRSYYDYTDYLFSYVVGQPVNFYMPIYAGVNPENGAPQWYKPGDDYNVNTQEEVTENFSGDLLQNTGKPLDAPISGGFRIGGNWKGLSLQADFSYVLNKWMYNNESYFYCNGAISGYYGYNQSYEVLDYWKEPGDVTKFPDWTRYGRQFDSSMLEDASFLRLKNLTVAYQFPQKWFQSQDVVSGFKVYLTGRNLWTATKFTGVDPEVDTNLVRGTYVNSKQYIVGLELTF